ncbi:MAG: VWA domain-containing protein [Chromatiales bacterium]|nr:VWA domain-containing protein [Chromatiales bacterium]
MPEFAQPLWVWGLLALPVLALYASRFKSVPGEAWRRRFSGWLRFGCIIALIVALAGPLRSDQSNRTDVIFALDVSASVDAKTAEKGLSLVNHAIREKDAAAGIGVVVFAASATTEMRLTTNPTLLDTPSAEVESGATNIAKAMELAVSGFTGGGHRRVVLLSDGRETEGNALAAAAVARSVGVEVMTVVLPSTRDQTDVRVVGLHAPRAVSSDEPFELRMVVQAAKAGVARMLLMRNGELIAERDVSLQPGMNQMVVVEQVEAAGLNEYEALILVPDDPIPENNRYQTFVQIAGPARILHAVGKDGWGEPLTRALRAQELHVDEAAGTALPATLHGLSDYDLVILNNVSGFDLSIAKMQQIENYVRDAGGGLMMLGGERSYSAGGYYATPIERALPVTMDIKSEVKIPSLAVTIIIDKSGSMSTRSRGEEKLAIAKQAALAALEVLNPLDQVGVLAFDTQFEWAVPITEVGNRKAIAEQLRTLGAGGGTELRPALGEALDVMSATAAKVKHLIILSDGLTDTSAELDALVQDVSDNNISISTVAFGEDADQSLMESIATRANGRFYFTDDPRNIPRIFVSETMVVSRGLLVEEQTQAFIGYPGEMLRGFTQAELPLLSGYQRAYARAPAQVLMTTHRDDPLLVSWRYGLGKSVAFTSDLSSRWGREWIQWPRFSQLAAQMARWTMRQRGNEIVLPTFRWQGRRGEVVLDVFDREDNFVNKLALQARVTDPRRAHSTIDFEQVSPGRYRAEFAVQDAGRYYFNMSDANSGKHVGRQTFGLAIPYSSEYAGAGADPGKLAEIASVTGGQALAFASSSVAQMLADRPGAIGQRWQIWWPFVLLALVLLLMELVVRKVSLPQRWATALRRSRVVEEDATYGELVDRMARVRSEHLAALTTRSEYPSDDPAVRARLYVAGRVGPGNFAP